MKGIGPQEWLVVGVFVAPFFLLVAWVARAKGRSGAGWLLLALLVTPVLAVDALVILMAPPLAQIALAILLTPVLVVIGLALAPGRAGPGREETTDASDEVPDFKWRKR